MPSILKLKQWTMNKIIFGKIDFLQKNLKEFKHIIQKNHC